MDAFIVTLREGYEASLLVGEGGASEALELAAPLAAVLYGAGFSWLFLRGLRAGAATA